MNDAVLPFFFGVFCGIAMIGIGSALPTSLLAQARKEIALCEKDLPRSQHCVIIAVPEEKK